MDLGDFLFLVFLLYMFFGFGSSASKKKKRPRYEKSKREPDFSDKDDFEEWESEGTVESRKEPPGVSSPKPALETGLEEQVLSLESPPQPARSLEEIPHAPKVLEAPSLEEPSAEKIPSAFLPVEALARPSAGAPAEKGLPLDIDPKKAFLWKELLDAPVSLRTGRLNDHW